MPRRSRPCRPLPLVLSMGASLLLALAGCGPGEEPVGVVASAGADGARPGPEIYRDLECAGCHEQASRPGLAVIPLAGLRARYDVEALAAWLAAPPPPMPPVWLEDEERRRLASYVLERFP